MFQPAGGRVGGASDYAVAVHQSYPPNTTPVRDFEVGVVDTGFAVHENGPHPWLANHIEFGADNAEKVPTGLTGMLADTDGHGTFVTGLVLREAPAARVRMVKPGDWANDATVAEAITSLKGCPLVNLSFAGTGIESSAPEHIARALNGLGADTVVVIAAGNQGRSDVVYPAGVRAGRTGGLTIAVGAVDETRTAPTGAPPAIAGFSNHGTWVDCYASGVQVLGPHCCHQEEQHFRIPRVPQVFRGWALWSGTSFAAATVTGAIARLAMEQDLSPREAAEALLRAAPRIPVPRERRESDGRDEDPIEWKPYVRGVASTWGEITTEETGVPNQKFGA